MRALFAALLSTTVLAACSTPNAPDRPLLANGEPVMSSGADAYERGKQNLFGGNYGLAAGQLRAALRNEPMSLDILNALALTYDRLGRHDVSQHYFAQALAVDPRSVQTLNNIARALLDNGAVDIAVSYLKRAEALDPRNPVVLANLADATRRDPRDSTVRSASASSGITPTTVWIERTSASKQTLVTRGELHFVSGVAEQNAILPLVNFSMIVESEKPRVEPEMIAVVEIPTPSREPVKERPNIVVANGNGRTGMAARMRSYLERQGWQIGSALNADQFNYATTTIAYITGHEGEARRLAALLPVEAALVEKDDLATDVVLRIGRDLLPFDHTTGVEFKTGGQHDGSYVDL
jgi:tetratricopeptide (TPR) repeat protein